MLVLDSDGADALVCETLGSAEDRNLDLSQLFAIMISRRRLHDDGPARGRPRGAGQQSEVARGFEALPLMSREVLALVVVERLAYDEAARILGLPAEIFTARLTQARSALARHMERDSKIVLRLVK
jgi:hypothetical protein